MVLPFPLKLIHRFFKPFQKHHDERIYGPGEDLIQLGLLGFIKNTQDIVGRIHVLRRSSHAYLQSWEVISAHPLDNGSDPLVPSVPSSPFKAKIAKGKIQIVMNDDEIFHPDVEKVGDLFNRLATSIHERRGFRQDNLLTIDPSCAVE